MLQAKDIIKTFWSQNILDWADILLWDKVKAGLVWVNGSGKSTLLKILSWEDKDFQWKVSFDVKNPMIGYMHQQINIADTNKTIQEFLKWYVGIDTIESHMNELALKLEDEKYFAAYSDAYELFEKMWWYVFDANAEQVLHNLWLGKYDLQTNIKRLSWWEKNKLLLSATLLKWWDVLLLDEPTNNLDSNSIEWLTSYIQSSLASCLIISHDRHFLNEIVNKVFEIEDTKKKILEYTGNYDFYEEEKQRQYNRLSEWFIQQEDEIKRIKKTIQEKKERAAKWANTTRTDNDKWARNSAREWAEWSNKVAKWLQQRIEQMDKLEKPAKKKDIELILDVNELPMGDIIISNIKYTYHGSDDFSLNIPEATIGYKDKVIVSWDNGQGKSTFIKLLTWELTTDIWTIRIHPSIHIWYFSQEQHNLPWDKTPVSYIESAWSYTFEEANRVLAKLWFNIDDRSKKINLLSPGMKARLVFALISIKKYNCLIFDEPTNHVDIETVKELEKAIDTFPWISIVVSHDKKFIENIGFTKKIAFDNWFWKQQIL